MLLSTWINSKLDERGTETDQHIDSHLNKFWGNKTVIDEHSLADRYLCAAIITKEENNETKKKTNKSAEAAPQGPSPVNGNWAAAMQLLEEQEERWMEGWWTVN